MKKISVEDNLSMPFLFARTIAVEDIIVKKLVYRGAITSLWNAIREDTIL